ncbi:MAG: hypothetical protein V3T22_07615, partial [Planctomycetota bacterium]
MDKRLPLFLFLSFLIVIAWPRPGGDTEAGDQGDAPPAYDPGLSLDDVPPLSGTQSLTGTQPGAGAPAPDAAQAQP